MIRQITTALQLNSMLVRQANLVLLAASPCGREAGLANHSWRGLPLSRRCKQSRRQRFSPSGRACAVTPGQPLGVPYLLNH